MDSYVFHKVSFIYMFGSASANIVSFIPECVARVPVSLWGSGG